MPELKQGTLLLEIIGQSDPSGSYVHVSVHEPDVERIEVGQIAGPGGWIDVAIVHYRYGGGKQIHPLYMMETIRY